MFTYKLIILILMPSFTLKFDEITHLGVGFLLQFNDKSAVASFCGHPVHPAVGS